MSKEAQDEAVRFLDRVDFSSPEDCWTWKGSLTAKGYGQLGVVRDGKKTTARAHRFSYELFIGPIPAGLVLDHLCRNRSCVNPSHLEAVTIGENVMRGEGLSALNACTATNSLRRTRTSTPEAGGVSIVSVGSVLRSA